MVFEGTRKWKKGSEAEASSDEQRRKNGKDPTAGTTPKQRRQKITDKRGGDKTNLENRENGKKPSPLWPQRVEEKGSTQIVRKGQAQKRKEEKKKV